MSDERERFVQRFGGVYEHSPWVAARCFDAAASIRDAAGLAALFARCVDEADRDTKLALIRAHPDLAGKAARRGDLTADSSVEQASAGIDQCSDEEYARFHALNDSYREKFGFPFVMAVRDSSRGEILDAFERRLGNDPESEFETAIAQIHRIARLRIDALFESGDRQ